MSAQTSVMSDTPRRQLRTRHLWIVPGLAIAVYANAVANEHGLGLVPLLLFGILPNVALVLGPGHATERGQLAPRAVPLWNALHHPAVPLVVAGIAATGAIPAFWLVGGLAWLGSLVVAWGFGDGLRSADGFRLPGLGRLIGVRGA